MNRSQQKYSQKHSAGFSLIEFLVASVLSMIVLIAIGSGYFAARKINDVSLGRLGVQQDMRNAANLIVRDARMAGSFG
ncbi:MAG: prepilin-type N-terminal cleavage/methylation domain-containing protein, partial [Neisseria sp.]|nr:prepilin-type N-terminal cleavage/methylation domain-containing protein [Neisseria sp.]